MKGPNADKAGAIDISAYVWAATDCRITARSIDTMTWLARTPAAERRALDRAEQWLRNRLGGNAPRDGEQHIWGRVDRGRWEPVTCYGVEDAELVYDTEQVTVMYGDRYHDGSVMIKREEIPTPAATP